MLSFHRVVGASAEEREAGQSMKTTLKAVFGKQKP